MDPQISTIIETDENPKFSFLIGNIIFGILLIPLIIIFIYGIILYSGAYKPNKVQATVTAPSSGGITTVTYTVGGILYTATFNSGSTIYTQGQIITVYYSYTTPGTVYLTDTPDSVGGLGLMVFSGIAVFNILIIWAICYAAFSAGWSLAKTISS